MGKKENGRIKFTTTIDEILLHKVQKKAIDLKKDVNEIIEELFKGWLEAKR